MTSRAAGAPHSSQVRCSTSDFPQWGQDTLSTTRSSPSSMFNCRSKRSNFGLSSSSPVLPSAETVSRTQICLLAGSKTFSPWWQWGQKIESSAPSRRPFSVSLLLTTAP